MTELKFHTFIFLLVINIFNVNIQLISFNNTVFIVYERKCWVLDVIVWTNCTFARYWYQSFIETIDSKSKQNYGPQLNVVTKSIKLFPLHMTAREYERLCFDVVLCAQAYRTDGSFQIFPHCIPMKRQIPEHYIKCMQITSRPVAYEIVYFQSI